MFPNPNGKLQIYANSMGKFYGERLVDELNLIIDDDNRKKNEEHERVLEPVPPEIRPAFEHIMDQELENRVDLLNIALGEYPDTNQRPWIKNSVRGQDAYLVQWLIAPPGAEGIDKYRYSADRLAFEFFKSIDALRNSGIKRLSLIMPYAYDQRKDVREGRDAIGSLTFCKALGGITGQQWMAAFCLDIHCQQEEGFYQGQQINMDSVPMFDVFTDHVNEYWPEITENAIVLAPDLGASKRARNISERIKAPVILIDKRRLNPVKTVIDWLAAGGVDPRGKTILLFDDVLASGGTAIEAAEYLQEKSGASKGAYFFMTHPSITNLAKLDAAYKKGVFRKIFLSDSVALPDRDYFEQVNTAKKLSRIIWNAHTDRSIGDYLLS